MPKCQKGFAPVIIIFAIALISGVIIGGSYYIKTKVLPNKTESAVKKATSSAFLSSEKSSGKVALSSANPQTSLPDSYYFIETSAPGGDGQFTLFDVNSRGLKTEIVKDKIDSRSLYLFTPLLAPDKQRIYIPNLTMVNILKKESGGGTSTGATVKNCMWYPDGQYVGCITHNDADAKMATIWDFEKIDVNGKAEDLGVIDSTHAIFLLGINDKQEFIVADDHSYNFSKVDFKNKKVIPIYTNDYSKKYYTDFLLSQSAVYSKPLNKIIFIGQIDRKGDLNSPQRYLNTLGIVDIDTGQESDIWTNLGFFNKPQLIYLSRDQKKIIFETGSEEIADNVDHYYIADLVTNKITEIVNKIEGLNTKLLGFTNDGKGAVVLRTTNKRISGSTAIDSRYEQGYELATIYEGGVTKVITKDSCTVDKKAGQSSCVHGGQAQYSLAQLVEVGEYRPDAKAISSPSPVAGVDGNLYHGEKFRFKYPSEWKVTKGVDDYFNSGKELVGLGVPGSVNMGGSLIYTPDGSIGATLCQDANKNSPSTVKFEQIAGKEGSHKCIFTNLKSNVDEFNGFVYMYNFKNKKGTEAIGIDVRVDKQDPDLEKKLDTLVSSVQFKSDL